MKVAETRKIFLKAVDKKYDRMLAEIEALARDGLNSAMFDGVGGESEEIIVNKLKADGYEINEPFDCYQSGGGC